MTVISVEPQYGGLSGTGSLGGVREYVKVFIVRTDSTADGVKTVGNALGLPQKGWVYTWHGETDAGALCYRVHPEQDPGNQNKWEVTCEYSSDLSHSGKRLGGDPRYDVDNPFAAPPEVTWGNWVETEVITHDVHDEPILNPVGRPYNPPLTRQVKRRAVTIIRNEVVYPIAIDQAYTDSVNSDLFYDWPPGTARLDDVTATAQFAQAMFYWRVKYDFQFKKPSWKREVLRAGIMYHEWDGVNQVMLEVMPSDKDSVYHTDPILLSETGEKLTPAEIAIRRQVPRGQLGGLYDYKEVNESKPFVALNL